MEIKFLNWDIYVPKILGGCNYCKILGVNPITPLVRPLRVGSGLE